VDAYCASLAEEDLAACTDGIDNDGNGFTDCDDWSCSQHGSPEAVAHCAAAAEATVEACTDGIDNDGNGFVDCADFGCSKSPEAEVAALCVATAELGPEACSDGKDNDGNGFIDCDDFSCSKDEANAEVCPLAALCSNYSLVFLDLCYPTVAGEERDTLLAIAVDHCEGAYNTTICNEHIVGCLETETTCEGFSACRDVCVEESVAQCTDGVDNNGNGYTDCEDFGCSDSDDFAVRQVCQESVFRPYPSDDPADPLVASCKGSGDSACDELRVGQANAACSDGQDNDGDGFADCDDWDCSWNPLVTVCEGPRVCE
ncbi:MAG: hypothetical protein VYE15_08430, partial [Myxococcota bacterium]|nr:hypothetical protein [Myxococcota bacterium]